ncbi:alanine racemase [Eggerthellaceae bacterium zg-1084]|uniref:Alanine racemase n=1 Tax=Berryella wangjianweii TaxID=2734634 RepID=A0A6M8J2I6_9ACTN|nr:alanine racemase [Berryella wangjianweii]NPD31559.1 alanine racemase [Berryella wangjianweii]NPD32946.1 alanine racemase [Eggerthellaceae bacterium zg-997]QKF07817.1 alanine racemase [Berryella wangjianweii]
MSSSELPNGFTGFARKQGFVSAAQAMRGVGGPAAPLAPASAAASGDQPAGFDPQLADSFDLEALDAVKEAERRWSWVQIDLSAVRHNLREARRLVPRTTRVLAVVKADAYGHGAVRVAQTALAAGADHLGVATVSEGVQLRRAGITAPILVLSQPPATSIELLLAYQVTPSVYDAQFAVAYGEAADAHGMRAPFHLAVNSGMNRIGVRHDEVGAFMMQVGFHRALRLEGVFTHFATADTPDPFEFDVQAGRFEEAVATLRGMGVDPGIVHAANSAATVRYPGVHYDMVRWGICLYGFHPCPETRQRADLRPVMSVHARITDARLVPMSEGVSYGFNYRSPGSVKICTVPIGYADGLARGLSGRIDFLVQGRRFHQVGNICMDQCMFEADMRTFATRQRIEPQVGDEVIIVGSQGDQAVTIDDMAAKLGTISYEVAIGFSHRMPRYFV